MREIRTPGSRWRGLESDLYEQRSGSASHRRRWIGLKDLCSIRVLRQPSTLLPRFLTGTGFVGTRHFPPGVTTFSVNLPGRVVALDAAAGQIVWQLSGSKQVLGSPAVSSEGVDLAGDCGGTVWGSTLTRDASRGAGVRRLCLEGRRLAGAGDRPSGGDESG
ncbi:MAG TPA: hypothetical protein VEP50_14630 [bacterium]|nr:hypothetical protein [bacterium]